MAPGRGDACEKPVPATSAITWTPDWTPTWTIVAAIGGIYLSQSMIGGLSFQGVPAALRASGGSLAVIGLFSLILLPWVLKFLWAPLIERWRLPSGAPRRSRQVVAAMQALALGTLVMLASTGMERPWLLFALLMLLAFAAATADIACDGYAVQQLAPAQRGWGNAAQVGGGYLGIVAGSGLFLWLLDRAGWGPACFALAGLMALLSLPFLVRAERHDPGPRPNGIARPSLRRAWRRPQLRSGLILVLTLMAGMRLAHGMIGPFLVDSGFGLGAIGVLRGGGAVVAGLLGTVAAGFAVRRWGAGRILLPLAGLQILTMLPLPLFAGLPDPPALGLAAALLAQTATMAAAFVALYSMLMGLALEEQAGVDFTIFQCADAAVATIAGIAAGLVAEHFGYAACFAVAVAIALGGALALPRVLRRCAA